MKSTAPGPFVIALAGLVSLAVAMGIGRFAFTPLLPIMLGEGLLDLPASGWLASANYVGYLVGAVGCSLQPWLAARLGRPAALDAPRWVRGGLAATALLTGAMALPWAAGWPLWRFAAGVASAVVLVYTSGWCLAQLALRGRPQWGGAIYAGPGAGIVVSGLSAGVLVAGGHGAAFAWGVFALLAAGLSALVWPVFRPAAGRGPAAAPAAPGPAEAAPGPAARRELAVLVAAYGLAGFGYIVTATFLPVIARQALPGSPWLDLFWPTFGAGVFVGALLATRLPAAGDRRLRLAAGYAMQALGIALGLAWPSLPGFVLGSLLLGLPFTAITFFAMQEVRRLDPQAAAPRIGLATAAYGLGQILGPVMVSALLQRSASAARGFDLALGIAASALLLGVGVFLGMRRAWPLR
ncbi:YbfB/YjiJ family MFS transporter [Piscinibacter sakaiensis]|uniref:Permease, major facilitator superfamily n=1 Tax=Piscinibacter sakaiensis TaxID=1547922 RepID=A0A0K8NXW1_PISS1|nr:YbfB/YjiJ family MFS transporter [Piscinibacter sakaiensis]GAP34765.1 permease, major facilitator superfamily [Piscinibacter sakaiensis]